MKDEASDIIRRANAQGISISELCRRAGVSRQWFEFFKKRIPQAVEAYLKIDNVLNTLETQKNENH